MFNIFFADIDECVNNTVCDSHGFCDNTAGSFRCLCYQGFQAPQDGQGCVGEFLVFVLSPSSPHHVSYVLSKRNERYQKVGKLRQETFYLGFIFIIRFEIVEMVCPLASEVDRNIKKEVCYLRQGHLLKPS